MDGFEGECSAALVGLIKSMMRTDPLRRPTAAAICGHRVVARARLQMEKAGRDARGEAFRASPLAGEEPGFVEALLGEGGAGAGADAMDVC